MTAEKIEKHADVFAGLEPAMPRAPDDIARDEGYVRASDGHELFWQSWVPADGEIHGNIALMHGFGEHSTRYHHVASAFCRLGYGVFAIDARGHGRSSGKRGFIESFQQSKNDYEILVKKAGTLSDGPTFCLGHSNGGLVSLHHAMDGATKPNCYAITSPFCGFQVHVPAVKAALGNVMSKVYPGLALPTELDAAHLSHNQDVVRKYERDPLVLKIATARWFTETKKAHAEALARAKEIETPFLWLVAGADEVADPKAAERVYHHMGVVDRELEIFPDLYHEVLNEDVWSEIVLSIADWFERHA